MTIQEAAQPAARSYPSPRSVVLAVRGLLGRHLSIRAKLTLWYGLMVALTLILTGVGTQFYLNQQINNDIDRRLANSALQTAARLHSPPAVPNGPSRYCYGADGSISYYCSQIENVLNTVSISLSAPGQFENVLVQSPCTAPPSYLQSVTTPPGHYYLLGTTIGDEIRAAFASGKPQFTTVSVGSEHVRAYLTVVVPPKHVTAGTQVLLAVFLPEHVYTRVFSLITLTLLLGLPIGLLIALVSGWWIA